MFRKSAIQRETPVFRVFISSTFSDFQAERDYLDAEIFPLLREFCTENGAEFQPVDLRWGISDEASREMRAVELCERELIRCQQVSPRPNFLILAGDRYGWCPPPRKISSADWELLTNAVSTDEKSELLHSYLLDENAIPNEYVYVRENEAQPTLFAEILRRAAQKAFPDDELRRLSFEASVTHQEIWAGAIAPSSARDHVFLFRRRFFDIPPVANDSSLTRYADYSEDSILDDDKFERQSKLCDRLIELLPRSSVHEAVCSIRDWPSSSLLKEFGHRVHSHLHTIISEEIRVWQKSVERMEEFDVSVENMIAGTIQRKDSLKSLDAMLSMNTGCLSFLVGRSGTGKSTTLAMLVQERRNRGESVLWIPIGSPQFDRNLMGLLNGIVRSIANVLGEPFELIDNIGTVATEMSRLLNLNARNPLTVVIDGLDQLDEQFRAHELWWLPEKNSTRTTVIASAAIDGNERNTLGAAIASRATTTNSLELGDLGIESAIAAVDGWLASRGRIVSGEQRHLVVQSLRENNSALYARLVGHALESRSSFDAAVSLPAQVHTLFETLCNEWGTETAHGRVLVKAVLGYISLSPSGLSEGELLDLLNQDNAVHESIKRRFKHAPIRQQIPFAVWSRLRRDLDPFLSESLIDKRLVLFHRQIRNAAANWVFVDETSKRKIHGVLADYFLLRGKSAIRSIGNNATTARFISLATFHALESGSSEQIHKLADPTVQSAMEKCLGAGRSQAILEDCCRKLATFEMTNWQAIADCARGFMKRQRRISESEKTLRGIVDYLYQGDLNAAFALVHTQGEIGNSIRNLAMAEILRSLGNAGVAEKCRKIASTVDDDRFQIDLTRQEFLLSLLESFPRKHAQVPIAVHESSLTCHGSEPNTRATSRLSLWAMLVIGSTTINALIFLTWLSFALSFSLLDMSLLAWVVSGFDSAKSVALGTFSAGIGLFVCAMAVSFARCMGQHFLRLVGRKACNEAACEHSHMMSHFRSTRLCYVLDALHFDLSRPSLLDPHSAVVLVSASVRIPHPMLAARLLAHCSTALPWNSTAIATELKRTPATKQRLVISALSTLIDMRKLGVPLLQAVANCARFPETAEVVCRIYEALPGNDSRLTKRVKRFSFYRSKERDTIVPNHAYIIESIPRSIRAEILLLTKLLGPPSHRMSRFVFATLPKAYWDIYCRTSLFEKLLLGVALLLALAVFQLYFYTVPSPLTRQGLLVDTMLVGSFVIVLACASAYNRWVDRQDHERWLNSQSASRPKNNRPSENIFLAHKTPPWDWNKWYPMILGWAYFSLLFARSKHSLSGRQMYGNSIEEDVERYKADWESLIGTYNQSVPRHIRLISPPIYSFLGPAGIEDLLLARIIIQRGWKAAINGPRFSDDAWTRVTSLLIRSDWLGRHAEFVADVLPSAPAVRVMIEKTHLHSNQVDLPQSMNSLVRRLLKNADRINDMQPQIFHRTVVALVAILIAFGTIHSQVSGIFGFLSKPMSDFELCLWCGINLIATCVFVSPTKSTLMRTAFAAIGFATMMGIIELTGGAVRETSFPLSTSQARGWAFAIVSTCSLSTLFFAPWAVAVFRGSLLLCPNRLQLFRQRLLAVLMIPLLCILLSLHLHFLSMIWQGIESIEILDTIRRQLQSSLDFN